MEDSEIAYIDSLAIRLIDWWENSAAPDSFTRSGVRNTVIRNNEVHHLGLRTDRDNAVGASFSFANKLRFEGNHVHHVGSVLVPGLRYTLPITGTGGGFTQATSVDLLVGGKCVYLPLVTRK